MPAIYASVLPTQWSGKETLFWPSPKVTLCEMPPGAKAKEIRFSTRKTHPCKT